jgi:transcriptional regulator with XRE-family HTH domain
VVNKQRFLKLFGQRIAYLRHRAGLTQEQLADSVDLHRTYIGYIEQGKRNPSIDNIHKIAGVLKISLKELFKDF